MKFWGSVTLERAQSYYCMDAKQASLASEENFVKNKRFMLSEGILGRILPNK